MKANLKAGRSLLTQGRVFFPNRLWGVLKLPSARNTQKRKTKKKGDDRPKKMEFC
jgi:hypothetical protein